MHQRGGDEGGGSRQDLYQGLGGRMYCRERRGGGVIYGSVENGVHVIQIGRTERRERGRGCGDWGWVGGGLFQSGGLIGGERNGTRKYGNYNGICYTSQPRDGTGINDVRVVWRFRSLRRMIESVSRRRWTKQ